MVAPRADEGGRRAVPLRQVETEDAAIKGERPLEVGDLQVHMADLHTRINA
jgi:hypothetical protein